jgi:PadR family transcriptional regulator PadR
MADRTDVRQGTLALMVLKTLEAMGPLHGYGIARRIEQISGQMLAINYGTLYQAKFYRLTRAGRRRVERETKEWERTSAILGRFLSGEQPS